MFVALLIFYVSKRKKQNSRRNGELPLFCVTAGRSKIPTESFQGDGTLGLQRKEGDGFRTSGLEPEAIACSILWLV